MVAPRPISDTTYAILPVAGYVASGKVEDFIGATARFER